EAGGRLLVVARALHDVQAASSGRFGVTGHAFDARRAGLRDRAERLDRDVEQAALHVARRWVLVELRAPLRGVLLVPVDRLVDGAAGGGVLGAVRDDVLGAAELGDLGDEHRAA